MGNTKDIKLNIKLQLILVVSIMIISLGVSYAFFDNIIHDNNSLTADGFSTGGLVLNYDGSSVINLTNIEPGLSVSKQFVVTNVSSATISSYNISFINLRNTLVNTDEFKYTITCVASSGSCSGKTATSFPTESTVALVGSSIAAGVTHTYTINLSFLEMSSYQNYNQNKKIAFKIVIGNQMRKLTDAIYEDYGSGDSISSETTVNNILGRANTPAYVYYINEYYTSNSMYSSSSSGNMTVGAGFTFNESTGMFQLTTVLNNRIFSAEYLGFYTCGPYMGSSCSTMYKLIGDIDTTTNPSYVYVHTLYGYNVSQIIIDRSMSLNQTINTSEGLYSSTTGNKYVGTGFYVSSSGLTLSVYLTNYTSNQRYVNSVGKYALNSSYYYLNTNTVGNSIKVYKILTTDTVTDPTKEYVATADVYTVTNNGYNPKILSLEDLNKSGLYKTSDIDGTTHYFKGQIKNNVVSFAGFTWRILRINGDGSIRLVKTASVNLASVMNTASYCRSSYTDTNSNYYDCMKFGTVAEGEYSNRFEDTSMSKMLNDWYNMAITSKYDKFLVNSKTCENITYSNALSANQINFTLSSNYANNVYVNYKCEMVNGSLGTNGDAKMLTLKVSFLNDTDKLLAGNINYTGHFLNGITSYSLCTKYSSGSLVLNTDSYGGGPSYTISSVSSFSIFPVISLNANVKVIGSGSLSDPYIVTEL